MQSFTDSIAAVSQCLNLLIPLKKKKFKSSLTNKDPEKISRYSNQKRVGLNFDNEKNKKISPDKKTERNKRSRFSINQSENNFSLDNNGRNSPNEYEEIFPREDSANSTNSTVNDNIGGSMYRDKRKSQSAENINKKRKSVIIRKKSAEINIGVITPQKINKKNSIESISSKDSSSTINLTDSEYYDDRDEKLSSGASLRTSSESNNVKKIEQ